MAYSDPNSTHNPATNTIAPAAWGDVVRDDLEWLARNKPRCHAQAGGAQSLSNVTYTTIALGTEAYDVGGCHSTVTNNSRLTVPSGGAGIYLVQALAAWASNSSNTRQCRIVANGLIVLTQDTRTVAGSYVHFSNLSCFANLNDGDYVELQMYQDSGGSLNTDGTSCWLAWHWMAT